MLTINQILQQGRYRIIAPLGQNETGADYEAYDNSLEKSVLLKEISVSLSKITTSAQIESNKLAFSDDAENLMQIKHQTLSQVNDYFSRVDCHYLVTELDKGQYLSEQLKKNETPFALTDVTNWAEQLLEALQYLHTQISPIIHCDIKPQNLKLNSDGKIQLLTFGIVKNPKVKEDVNFKNRFFDATSLPYSPLEQIWDDLDAASQKLIINSYDEKSGKLLEQPADARSDIYALGATLYHLATARVPVDALTRSIDILEGKSDPLPTPNQVDSAIAPEISEILMKAMEIKRENRFSAPVIMRQVLRTAFVRVKEREENGVQEVDDVLEIPSAEQFSFEQERLKIEAEQKHLEEQRRIVEVEEQRRIVELEIEEIEAESKRKIELLKQHSLEQERLKLEAEQEKLKLEAEQEKLKLEAEQERLKLEAEQERLKLEAEQERLKLEAEQEKLKLEAEQERLKLEAEQERLKLEAEQKRLADQRRIVEQEIEEIEAESKRKIELLKQQSSKAEIKELAIEKDFASIEKQVVETETEELVEVVEKPLKLNEDFAQTINSVNVQPDAPINIQSVPDEPRSMPKVSSVESDKLVAEPQKETKSLKKMAAAAGALLIFGGAAFGIWSFMTSKTTEVNQTVSSSNTPTSSSVTTEPTVQKTEATSEITSETSPIPKPSVLPVKQNPANTETVKTKPVLPTPSPTPTKKQIAQTKTPEKKSVTVDNLIGDN